MDGVGDMLILKMMRKYIDIDVLSSKTRHYKENHVHVENMGALHLFGEMSIALIEMELTVEELSDVGIAPMLMQVFAVFHNCEISDCLILVLWNFIRELVYFSSNYLHNPIASSNHVLSIVDRSFSSFYLYSCILWYKLITLNFHYWIH